MSSLRYITALRFPLALLVVFIHAYNAPWQAVADPTFARVAEFCSRVLPTFAVPLFFAVSGYLFFLGMERFGMGDYLGKLRRRALTLLVPYVVWNVLAFGLYAARDWAAGASLQFPPAVDLLWGCRTLAAGGSNWLGQSLAAVTAPVQEPLWFVRDLMVTVVLAPLFWFVLRYLRVVGLVLLAVVFYARLWPNPCGVSFTAFWFFGLGAWFSISGRDAVRSLRPLTLPALVLGVGALAVLVRFPDVWPELRAVAQPLYVLCAMAVSVRLAGFLARKIRPSAFRSQASFFVYAAHTILLLPLSTWLAAYTVGRPVSWLVAAYLAGPILAATGCLVACWLLQRYLPRLSAPLTGQWPKTVRR